MKGSLKIIKTTIGGKGNENFKFDVTGTGYANSDTITHSGNIEFINLDTGNYTVKENLVSGFVVTDISCNGQADATPKDGQATVAVTAGQQAICIFKNNAKDDPTDDVTKKFIKRRLDNLLSSDPDRARIIRRLDQQPEDPEEVRPLKLTGKLNSGSFDNLKNSELKFSTSLNQLRSAEAARQNLKLKEAKKNSGLGFSSGNLEELPDLRPQSVDVWLEGQVKHYEDSDGGFDSDGTFGIVYLGVDYAATKNFLIGALVQFDWTKEDIEGTDFFGEAEGGGWMVGPYMGVKFADNLYFNARAAWGQSSNTIVLTDPELGKRTSDFDTDRWLVSGELGGKWEYYGLRIKPSVKVAYGNEQNDEFKNSLGQVLSANDISLGRIAFGPEFSYRFEDRDGTIIKPHISIKGLWNFGGDDVTLSDGTELDNKSFRAKVEGGLIVQMDDDMSVRFAAEYDGIGNSDYEAVGGQLWINVPLK